MADINKILLNVDDITINCYQAIAGSANVNSDTLFTSDGLLTNVLYNAGFMFTDILDIVYYDTTSTDPYWYYVAFRGGDFSIRFIYRDTTL